MEKQNENTQLSAKEEQIISTQKVLRKKSVMLMVSLCLVIVVLAALAIAWYTRVANTYAVTFDVADYDLTVNENAEEEYLLNVYDYSSVRNQKMVPGTIGWIPLKISAYHSDVDVQFRIALDSKMDSELQKHLRFFVLKYAGTDNYVYGEVANANDIKNTSQYTIVPLKPSVNGEGTATIISDTIRMGQGADSSKILCIFWEWYLDADTAYNAYPYSTYPDDGLNEADLNGTTEEAIAQADAIKKAWDELDTDIGRYPDKYYDAFTMYINTTGTQIVPNDGTRTRTPSTPVTPTP